jgi:hypothetical protein
MSSIFFAPSSPTKLEQEVTTMFIYLLNHPFLKRLFHLRFYSFPIKNHRLRLITLRSIRDETDTILYNKQIIKGKKNGGKKNKDNREHCIGGYSMFPYRTVFDDITAM